MEGGRAVAAGARRLTLIRALLLVLIATAGLSGWMLPARTIQGGSPVGAIPAAPPAPPLLAPSRLPPDPDRPSVPKGPFVPNPDAWAWDAPLPPQSRMVLFYGNPLSPALGPIGAYDEPALAAKLREQAAAYARLDPAHPVVAGLDYVDPVAQPQAMADGSWVYRMDAANVQHFVDLASRDHFYFFFDMQVGHSAVAHEVDLVWPYLRRGHVELSLDPEFDMAPGDTPGVQFGRMYAAEINAVVDRLSALVTASNLPPKILLIHQFIPSMLPDKDKIHAAPGVILVFCEDGVGGKAAKFAGYRDLADVPGAVPGFKVFYKLDTPAASEAEVVALNPPALVVMYQ